MGTERHCDEWVIKSDKGPMVLSPGDWIADEDGRGGELIRIYSDLNDVVDVLLDVKTAEEVIITLEEKKITFCQHKEE